MTPPYKLRSIRKKILPGMTSPVACSLDAILKVDGLESPYCVYSELVATRLAQTIHIPVAIGVITKHQTSDAYASIEIGTNGLRLLSLLNSQYKKAATQYKDEAAALMVFDIFIGNGDRRGNLKASFVTPHHQIFQGFDHERALLGIDNNPMESIKALRNGDLIVDFHPFYKLTHPLIMLKWCKRIEQLDDALIHECCEMGRPIGEVVGARLKIPRSGRCRITQSEGSLKLTGLLTSVAHLHRRSCVGSALNEHSPRG